MSGSSFQSLLMDGGDDGPPSPPTCVADPYYSCTNTTERTVLILHADDVTDSSCYITKTVALAGSASVNTSVKKFGSGSFLVPNAGTSTTNGITVADSTDFDFGSSDFTIELWFYRIADTYEGRIFTGWNSNTFRALVGTDGLLDVQFNTSGGAVAFNNQTTITPGQWYWLVLQRRNNLFQIFVDGVMINGAPPINAADTISSSGSLYFGSTNASSALSLNGYLDEIRITKAVAQHVPEPDIPYLTDGDDPDWANVGVLSYFNGTGASLNNDLSSNTYSIGVTGNAVASTTQSLFGGSSIYMDGTVDNSGATITGSTAAGIFSTSSLDIEVWCYPTQYPPSGVMYVVTDKWTTNNNGFSIQITTTGSISTTISVSSGPNGVAGCVRLNEWNSIRLRRSGSGTLSLLVNGSTVGSSATVFPFDSAGPVIVGWRPNSNTKFYGYIGGVRLTTGFRSSRNFSILVPTLPNCNSTTADGQPVNGTEFPIGQSLTSQQGALRLSNHYQPLTGQMVTSVAAAIGASTPALPSGPSPKGASATYTVSETFATEIDTTVSMVTYLTFFTTGNLTYIGGTDSNDLSWVEPEAVGAGANFQIYITDISSPNSSVSANFTLNSWTTVSTTCTVTINNTLFLPKPGSVIGVTQIGIQIRPIPTSPNFGNAYFERNYTLTLNALATSV